MLSAYDYDINFKHSKEHGNADVLLRLPLPSIERTVGKEGFTMFNVGQKEALPLTFQDIKLGTKRDATSSTVLDYVKRGWPKEVPNDVQPYVQCQTELSVENDCLLWGTRVVIPKSLQDTLLKSLLDNHPGISHMKALARSYFWLISLDKDIENLNKSCENCEGVKSNPTSTPLYPWYGQMLTGPISMWTMRDRSSGKFFL